LSSTADHTLDTWHDILDKNVLCIVQYINKYKQEKKTPLTVCLAIKFNIILQQGIRSIDLPFYVTLWTINKKET
jgi:hypothetical protein